jgi:hypothetical protein
MTTLEAILISHPFDRVVITVDEVPDFGIDYEVSVQPRVAGSGFGVGSPAYSEDPTDTVCGHGATIEDAARALQRNLASGVHHHVGE